MIETKEHYKSVLLSLRFNFAVGNLKVRDVEETIEALRDVARAGRAIKEAEDGYPKTHTELHIIGAHDDMAEALDALPDWILEEE